MQIETVKNKIKEKVILDKTNQNIIAALNQKIEKLEKELQEVKNIEKPSKNKWFVKKRC